MKMNINGTTKSINERIEDLEYSYKGAKEIAELAKKEISNKIVFGRMYIGSIEEFLKSLKTIEDIKLHMQELDSISDHQIAFNSIIDFSEKLEEIKSMIIENSQMAKANIELRNRIIILIEHSFSEWDIFAINLIEFIKE